MKNKIHVSVIVPVYNGRNFLDRCLDAIKSTDFNSIELIIVDDCSTDESVDIARAKGATVLSMDQNSGPAAARNYASKQAQGEILLFVDADVVIKPNTISLVVSRFQNHPEIAALFGSYDDAPGETNFLSQYKNLCHHYVHQNANTAATTFWAGLGAVKKDVFLEMGGFDCESYAIPSIEDIELGNRLRAANHRILLAKEIQATHLKRWEALSLIRTDIFCRALPWSKLIITKENLVNDMNLKVNERVSAGLVLVFLAVLTLSIFVPLLLLLELIILGLLVFLNRDLLSFFYNKRGLIFAAKGFMWQLLYFFYSSLSFAYCWILYGIPLLFKGNVEKEL